MTDRGSGNTERLFVFMISADLQLADNTRGRRGELVGIGLNRIDSSTVLPGN